MRKRSVKMLPRVIGLYGDQHTDHYPWVEGVIRMAKPNTVFVTTDSHIFRRFVERRVVLRRDLRYKNFKSDPWEVNFSGKFKADAFRDYCFLSYIKFHKGFLFILPAKYQTGEYGVHTSKRTDALIWSAHELGLKYEIIESEKEIKNSGSKRSKRGGILQTPDPAGHTDSYYEHSRTILSKSSKHVFDAIGESTSLETDEPDLGGGDDDSDDGVDD